MTQQDLADAAGVDIKTVYNLESGTRWPIARTRAAIASALGWDADALARIAEDGTPPAPRSDRPFTPPATTPEMEEGVRVHLPGIMARLEVARGGHPGVKPTGDMLFPQSRKYAELWDELATLGRPPEATAWFMAVSLSWEDQEARKQEREGFAAGLMRRRVTVPR